jgi:hypothetical protein
MIVDRAFPPLPERMDAADRADVEAVLEGALDWSEGFIDLAEFAVIGDIRPGDRAPSHGYSRYVAMRLSNPSDPRWLPLRQAVDQLLRLQGVQITRFGIFDADELAQTGAVIRSDPYASAQQSNRSVYDRD